MLWLRIIIIIIAIIIIINIIIIIIIIIIYYYYYDFYSVKELGFLSHIYKFYKYIYKIHI